MPSSRGSVVRSRFSNKNGVEYTYETGHLNAKAFKQRSNTDSNILRGAAIIRQQIQSQWEHDDEFVKKQDPSRPLSSPSLEKPLNEDHTHSFSSSSSDDDYDEDFSDPWANKSHIIKEVDPVLPRVITASTLGDSGGSSTTTSAESSFLGRSQTFESRGDGSQWADGVMMKQEQQHPAAKATSKTELPFRPSNKTTVTPSYSAPITSSSSSARPQQKSLLDAEDHNRNPYWMRKMYIVEPLHVPTYDEDEDADAERRHPVAKKHSYDFVEQDLSAGDFDDDNEELFHHSYLPQELRAQSSRRLLGDEPFVDAAPIVIVGDDEDLLMDKPPAALMREKQEPAPPVTAPTSSTIIISPIPDTTTAMVVPSPLSPAYSKLLTDPAFVHAQAAGHLWQSMLGNHIRFPKSWWEKAATPPMGIDTKDRRWWYHGRDSTYNPLLHRFVKHRSAPGRLLLHVIVRDAETWIPLQDLVVGCFHPAARYIRETEHADPNQDDCRDLWLAVRKRCDKTTAIDQLLSSRQNTPSSSSAWGAAATGGGDQGSLSWPTLVGPLGPDQRMTNQNVRATFGEKPPLETIFVPELELYERLVASNTVSPAMVLLREFVFA